MSRLTRYWLLPAGSRPTNSRTFCLARRRRGREPAEVVLEDDHVAALIVDHFHGHDAVVDLERLLHRLRRNDEHLRHERLEQGGHDERHHDDDDDLPDPASDAASKARCLAVGRRGVLGAALRSGSHFGWSPNRQ